MFECLFKYSVPSVSYFFHFTKWIHKVEKQSRKQRKLTKMERINGQMMKFKIWLNCLKRNPVCGIFVRTSTHRERWKKEFMQNWWNILIPTWRVQLGQEMAKEPKTFHVGLVSLALITRKSYTISEQKFFSITDFFSKCNQIRSFLQ